jgi:hypothetical protein
LKTETKKLLDVVGNVKKSAANNSQKQSSDLTKMSEEIASLKENKNFLEKKLRGCACASGGRGVKNGGDNRLDQITATAKAEIQKLVSLKGRK